jgi:hypothetical protein
MPRYEYSCKCDSVEKRFTVIFSINDYKPEIPCPCGSENAIAKRVFNSFAVQEGLTANEKKHGTTPKRKQMADFMKDQKSTRKKSYASDTREARSNEIWTGKEGLDGITSLPISRKQE